MKKILLFILLAIIFIGIILMIPHAKNQQKSPSTNTVEKQNETNPEATDAPYSDGISLTITNPENNATVVNSTIIVNGQTSPGADVFINEMELRANGAGAFSTQITLDEGENIIIVAVNDQEGNSAEKEIKVTYEPQE